MMTIRKTSGISLIEIMLSLSIIAVILIIATRYYESTRLSQKVNESVQTINMVKAAAGKWRSSKPTYAGMTWDELKKRGYLPADFGPEGEVPESPVGTAMTLSAQSRDSVVKGYKITFTAGSAVCLAVTDRYQDLKASDPEKIDIASCGASGVIDLTFWDS